MKLRLVSFLFVLFFVVLLGFLFKQNVKIKILEGYLSWKKKNWDSAMTYFEDARRIAKENFDDNTVEYALYAESSTDLMQNKLSSALDKLRMLENTHNKQLLSSVFYQLGMIAFMQQEYKHAAVCFKKSLEAESNSMDAKINYEISKKRVDIEAIHKAKTTKISDAKTNEAHNTLIDIFRRKEIEEWKEKVQTQSDVGSYDY